MSEEAAVALPTTLSLSQAAKEVGVAKSTITNAIKKGKLSATKNPDGSYDIQPAELFRAYPKGSSKGVRTQGDETPQLDAVQPVVGRGETLMLQAQLEAKSRECNLLETQLEDTRSERDKWQVQASSTQRLLEHQPRVEEKTEKPKSSGAGWGVAAFLLVALAAVGYAQMSDLFRGVFN